MIEDFKLWIQTYDQFYLFSITFVFCPHFYMIIRFVRRVTHLQDWNGLYSGWTVAHKCPTNTKYRFFTVHH